LLLATKVADRQKWLWASTKVANRPPCSMPTSKSGCAVRPVCVPKVADARDVARFAERLGADLDCPPVTPVAVLHHSLIALRLFTATSTSSHPLHYTSPNVRSVYRASLPTLMLCYCERRLVSRRARSRWTVSLSHHTLPHLPVAVALPLCTVMTVLATCYFYVADAFLYLPIATRVPQSIPQRGTQVSAPRLTAHNECGYTASALLVSYCNVTDLPSPRG
jgi:hypothetical protein